MENKNNLVKELPENFISNNKNRYFYKYICRNKSVKTGFIEADTRSKVISELSMREEFQEIEYIHQKNLEDNINKKSNGR